MAVFPLLGRALLRLKTAPGLPTAAAKIAIGVAGTGLAYIPLVVAALLGSDGSLVGISRLLRCLALLAVGELLFGALGPSLVLRLAPPTLTDPLIFGLRREHDPVTWTDCSVPNYPAQDRKQISD